MSLFGKKNGNKSRGERVYLDWAAAAPVSLAAAKGYADASVAFGNPSSPHTEGRAARALLEDARTTIAKHLEVKADDLIFTAGATEANNLAIQGVLRAAVEGGRAPSDLHALYLPSAHASVVETMKHIATMGVRVEPLFVRDGVIDIVALKKQLKPESILISMDFVCGETGTIWNVREVRTALMQSDMHAVVHVDASQAPLVESVERMRLGADLVTLDAQKVGGVRGLGILVAARSVPLAPVLFGGGQERDLRPGTQLPAAAAAFAAALHEVHVGRAAFVARAAEAKKALLQSVGTIEGVEVNGGKETVPHILNISLRGRDTDYILALLDEAGFAVSTKSACESDSDQGSRAVTVLTGDEARAKATLRISWGPRTTPKELVSFAKALRTAVAFVDAHKL